MKQFEITIKVEVLGYDELNSDEEQLALLAREATERSYAPYSNFRVGAAIALDNGEIVSGANQENVAYPSGICAERTALFYAGATFPGVSVEALAIAACFEGKLCEKAVSPCGACRQVMSEMIRRYKQDFDVIMVGGKETVVVKASDLLPFSFAI